jgi:hypothetical protein
MSRILRNQLVLGLICFTALPGIAKTLSNGADGPVLRITVRVFNYAEIPAETWKSAETVATRIFNRAGITTAWLDCSLSSQGQYLLADCALPAQTTDIILRLVATSGATRAHFGEAALGIAAPFEKGTPASASVFFDRVEALAKGGTASTAVILGHAAAHEIGHLLLGSNSHSTLGLMRAKWSRSDLQRANDGELLFLQREVISVQEEVQQRTRQRDLMSTMNSTDSQSSR